MIKCTNVYGDDKLLADRATISYNNLEAKNTEKLIELLITQNHLSIFEFASMEFYVEVPIYTQRQWMRHRTTFIEKSLRYTTPEDYFIPKSIQQSSLFKKWVISNNTFCVNLYNTLVSSGVPKEDARSVLPLGTMTKFYWKVNLRQLMNFLDQRLLPSAQSDIRENAEEVRKEFEKHFPITHKYWKKRKNPYAP